MPEYNGLLPLYKPKGMTSHDCVFQMRKLLKFRKIGHTGTLDPAVEGVLVLCLGKATKIAQYLLDYSKAYQGVIRLGTSTTTEDAEGEVIDSKTVSESFAKETVEQAMQSLVGEIEQSAPMYSAVKVNGRKLYEYARAGIPVTPPIRKVSIYQFEVDSDASSFSTDLPFKVSCSKGTYIRTLAVALGQRMGYPAHLHRMTRIQAGPFSLADCFTFEQIEQQLAEDRFADTLKPLAYGLSLMDRWVVSDELVEKIAHGAILPAPEQFGAGPHAVFTEQDECLAIYRRHPEKPGMVKPDKVLASDPNS
ncbi:tRNA pseudouridine(55) synthase TruB [Sporolactobacillus nakayamae]|uniref:tRNA pseudouridine synthase B n=1 Tax=Sporolactobacillus nakayamae TaxID=269670 RepID=A0A1I2NC90_9BACL|nr:tRNA pseudouridine(55) synthase TruB [Sporolactobacillus nakayamae]SFG00700.1 tRNA pseudouridine55 synthase [Sporolactobacillus nakayamae]